ncbi:MAG: uroporphyrinogen-III synthase [Actinomycetota bacterium]|nr:uroporphyrinogen-III synthase [Actinomycetota bacterium]
MPRLTVTGMPVLDPELCTVSARERLLAAARVLATDTAVARAITSVAAVAVEVVRAPEPETVWSAVEASDGPVVRVHAGDPLASASARAELAELADHADEIEVVPALGDPAVVRAAVGLLAPDLAEHDDASRAAVAAGATVVAPAERSPFDPSVTPMRIVDAAGTAHQHPRPAGSDPGGDVGAWVIAGRGRDDRLDWWARRPLHGHVVAVTRPRHQAGGAARTLRALGAGVVLFPTVEIIDPPDLAPLDRALAEIERYDWLVVTSANGASRVADRIDDARRLASTRIAAIGPATAGVLAGARLPADLVPERYVAESVLDAFPPPPDGGGRVLIARAAVARDVLPDGLAAAGWDVTVVDAYRSVAAIADDEAVAELSTADVIAFTAPSTFERFVEIAGAERLPPTVACIGPVTAAAVRDAGVDVAVEASSFTMDGLIDALVAWASDGSGHGPGRGPVVAH